MSQPQTQPDNINKYLTWATVWKVITVVCACVWFVAMLIKDNSIRDMEITQTKKDVSDIKGMLQEIQSDVKAASANTDGRLTSLEKRVTILETVNHIKPPSN